MITFLETKIILQDYLDFGIKSFIKKLHWCEENNYTIVFDEQTISRGVDSIDSLNDINEEDLYILYTENSIVIHLRTEEEKAEDEMLDELKNQLSLLERTIEDLKLKIDDITFRQVKYRRKRRGIK